MPLPWKKAKIDRVSRLVADLRSSNRRESLVVQTGFPTSLIDLIVKNRDCLKKPSRKKQNKNQKRKTSSSDSPLLPSNSINSTGFSVYAVAPPPPPAAEIDESFQREIGEDVGLLNHVDDAEQEEDEVAEESAVPNGRAFVLVVKLFLLLILAFGTKKLALGVTVSAFLLLFLEFTSKRLICFFKPCSDARKCLSCLVEKILVSVRLGKGNDLNRVEESTVVDSCLKLSEGESEALVDEIQIIDQSDDLDFRNSERSCEVVELDEKRRISLKDDEYVIEDEVVPSPRKITNAKLKEKLLKKLVILRKIRGSRSKMNKDCDPDSCSVVLSNCKGGEEKLTVGEEKEDEQELKEDELEEVDEEYNVSQLCCNGEAGENVGRRANWNSSHLIPFVIILAGLLRGRILALGLTTAWCALRKLGQPRKIQR